MQRFLLVVLVLSLLIPGAVFGQEEVNKIGSTAANFLKLEVGARAVALGGAFTSIANDGTAMLFNPAGLADFQKPTFTYHNVDLYADIRQHFTGIVIPFGENSAIGVYVNYVNLGWIYRTDIEMQRRERGQYVFSSNSAYGFSIARRLTDRVLFGISVKYIMEKYWNSSATNFALDFGTVYTPGVGGLKLGLAIKHLGPEMKINEGPDFTFFKKQEDAFPGNRQLPSRLIMDKYALPTTFSGGVAFDFVGPTSIILPNDIHQLTLLTEVNDAFDAPFRSIVGVEYMWNNMLSIRGGSKQNYDTFKYSFGGGVKIPIMNSEMVFDYAYADYGDLEGVYVTSIEIKF